MPTTAFAPGTTLYEKDNKPGVNPHIQDILDRGQEVTEEERTVAIGYFSRQIGNQRARLANPFTSPRKTAKNLKAIMGQAELAGYPEVAAQCQATLDSMGKDQDRGLLSVLTRPFSPFKS